MNDEASPNSQPNANTGGRYVPMGGTVRIDCVINGEAMVIEAEVRRSLSDVVREEVGLTGTHLGCEHGVCGACTVLVDGRAVRSCLMLAVQANGSTIRTIEGLADGDTYHPVQAAMHDAHGFQCSFCAPGFLMTTVALLERTPNPSEAEIRAELSGNLCRCTGYQSIVDGVTRAVKLINASGNAGKGENNA